jgi:hypothetical protein
VLFPLLVFVQNEWMKKKMVSFCIWQIFTINNGVQQNEWKKSCACLGDNKREREREREREYMSCLCCALCRQSPFIHSLLSTERRKTPLAETFRRRVHSI